MADVNTQQAGGPDTQQTNVPEQQQAGGQQLDYGKLEQIVSKGVEKKESAILKSYFEQAGMTGEEMQQAIANYKESKNADQKKQQADFAAMQAENEKLRQEIYDRNVNEKAATVAASLGIPQKYLADALKLVDRSKFVNEKKEVVEDNIKAELEAVVKRFPALKEADDNKHGFVIGANSNAGQAHAGETKPQVATKRWNRFNH